VVTFYLDRKLAVRVADALHRRGHQAVRTPLAPASPDYAHLLFAALRGWILVTHNGRDFKLLHGAWQTWPVALNVGGWPRHAGIVVPPQHLRWTEERTADELDALVASGRRLADTLYEWRASAGWTPWMPP